MTTTSTTNHYFFAAAAVLPLLLPLLVSETRNSKTLHPNTLLKGSCDPVTEGVKNVTLKYV